MTIQAIEERVRNVVVQWGDLLHDPHVLWQFAVLAIALASAWFATRVTRGANAHRLAPQGQFGGRELSRFLLPALAALFGWIGAAVLSQFDLPMNVLRMIAALSGALAAIRGIAFLLKRLLKPGPALVAAEHSISWAIWIFAALVLLGWMQPLGRGMDAVAIQIGGARVSLLDAVRTIFTVLLFVIASAYIGSLIERRLMTLVNMPVGLRVGIGKSIRFGLILLAALVAFNVVGIDLGGLTVFGGALGVGIGFGLQRIASNFVSGFILVGDRSIRPGDVITIGNRFGVVRELRARYIVVRDRDGVDTLIPNENVITSDVVNWSYSDRAIRLKLPVQISYRDNPRRAMELMVKAARQNPRVESIPDPVGRVMAFGENGIDLELRFWILNPEDGINNVRSDLYLSIWDAFNEAQITIPYPQRDVHVSTNHDSPTV